MRLRSIGTIAPAVFGKTICLASLVTASTCWATTVPNAVMDISVSASASGYDINQYQSSEVTIPMSQRYLEYGSSQYATSIGYSSLIYQSKGPSLEGITSAYKDGIASSGGSVQGTLTYYFLATGSDAFNVDWRATAAYAQSATVSEYTDGDYQEADLMVTDVTRNQNDVAVLNLNSEDGYYSGNYSGGPSIDGISLSVVEKGSGSFAVTPGDLYSVQLFIQAALGLGEGQGGIATEGLTSYIDPVFSVSSDNPNASADGLVFSNGITQANVTPSLSPLQVVPGVPELDTWTLILSGFGVVGAMLRWRKVTPSIRFA